jgi:membrane-associated phospholipid phosphatase
LASFAGLGAATAQQDTSRSRQVLGVWYQLVLELVRHTPTYSPPVASRSFAYVGVTAFEAVATGSDDLQSLAGQLNGLSAVPQREAGQTYDAAVVVQAALASVVKDLFANTGPTGQRAMASLEAKLRAEAADGVPPDVVARSEAHGRAVADHILAWSRDDGGAAIENMGFPLEYKLTPGPAHWVPTSLIRQQQFPLLPDWGANRTFAMSDGAACETPAPPAYSEDPTSDYYKEALEVYDSWKNLTPDQRAIARFWADDAMLSVTPPGHWLSIAMQIIDRDNIGIERSVDLLARLGIVEADAFIGCWRTKFVYDTVRPITYIRRVIDPNFETVVNTPPFPEFPSGHSTLSAAAAALLTSILGDDLAFDDNTDQADGLKPRSFPSFRAAADEAGLSRLYGGIHYRAAIEMGADQGRCIAVYAIALHTWR